MLNQRLAISSFLYWHMQPNIEANDVKQDLFFFHYWTQVTIHVLSIHFHKNVKGEWSYFKKVFFFCLFEETSLQRWNLKILVEWSCGWMYEAIMYIAVAYILLLKLNYAYHYQAHLISVKRKVLKKITCEICHGYMKMWAFLWYKNLQKFGINEEKNG